MRSDYVHPLLCHLYFAHCQVPAAHHCFEAANQPGERSAIYRLVAARGAKVSPARTRPRGTRPRVRSAGTPSACPWCACPGGSLSHVEIGPWSCPVCAAALKFPSTIIRQSCSARRPTRRGFHPTSCVWSGPRLTPSFRRPSGGGWRWAFERVRLEQRRHVPRAQLP